MNLTKEPEIVNFPATHYVFVEKHGDFHSIAGQAWKSAHALRARALDEKQDHRLHEPLQGGSEDVSRGICTRRARRWICPPAWPMKSSQAASTRSLFSPGHTRSCPRLRAGLEHSWEKKISVRDDYAIENYMNDPA